MRSYRRLFRLDARDAEGAERELDEEIRTHLEMRVDALVRQGVTPERAWVEARRRFGDLEGAQLRHAARRRGTALRRRAALESVGRDLMLAIRHMRNHPGYTVLAVTTLALGIGLTTAAFTLVDRVLLRDLPFPEPDRLVALQSADSSGRAIAVVSSANWFDWREQNESLDATALYFPRRIGVATADDAFRAQGQIVSGGFFEVLRNPMLVGRPFTEAEVDDGATVAVVSEGFWRRVMGGDVDLDDGLVANGQAVQVVGVIPAGLEYPTGTEVWLPRRFQRTVGATRNNVNWFALARLRAAVTIGDARGDLSRIANTIRLAEPVALYSYGVEVASLKTVVVGETDRYLLFLMVAVAFVLLLGCANLAGLNFARNSARRREMATRVALGASRSRLIQQLTAEHLMLALVGGLVGIGLASALTRLAASGAATALPRAAEIGIDLRIVAFALAVSVLAGILAGLAPAFTASESSPLAAMGRTRGTVRGGRNLPGALLVGSEIALAALLVTGGGLLVRSFRTLLARDLGFDPRGVVTAEIALTGSRYLNQPDRWTSYWDALLDDLRGIPGVAMAAVANWIPTGTAGQTFVGIEGRDEENEGAGYRAVSRDYFSALGIPLLRGRFFERRDTGGSARVVIVNQAMAERFWPGRDPLGRRVRAPSMEFFVDAPWLTVVGVVGDIRHWGFEGDANPEMYVLHRQVPLMTSAMTAVVRADGIPAAQLAAMVRARVRRIDPTIAADIELLETRVSALVAERRVTMTILTGLASLGLLLASIGVYGLMSFAVVQRTQEIAVRTAIGASRWSILTMVIASAVRVAVVGALIGLMGAYWLTRLMVALLVDTDPGDPFTFAAAASILLAVSALAAAIPAVRAARMHPVQALRG